MTGLNGALVDIRRLTDQDTSAMYSLMEEFYLGTCRDVFLRDLAEKDTCILLRDADHVIRGFSTQHLMTVEVDSTKVRGVFSGDTIIHRSCWGSPELFHVFARHFIGEQRPYPELYWFLMSKGYKTYKMLPLFFQSFYPRVNMTTPVLEQRIMDAYAMARYPEEYDHCRGIIAYRGVKDSLRQGVADITDRCLRDPDVSHFLKLNPGHAGGDDLVCLTRLSPENLKPALRRRLLGA